MRQPFTYASDGTFHRGADVAAATVQRSCRHSHARIGPAIPGLTGVGESTAYVCRQRLVRSAFAQPQHRGTHPLPPLVDEDDAVHLAGRSDACDVVE
jgi:hypothetical protein